MTYTTIFFDLDDTLIDTIKSSSEALMDMYEDHKFFDYFSSFESFYEKYRDININLWRLYENGQIDKNYLQIKRFQKTFEEYIVLTDNQSLDLNHEFMSMVSSKKNIIDGAIEILNYLQPRYSLNILSNGFNEVQDIKIEKAGITSFFQNIILSDHVGKNKPHPSIFKYALDRVQATSKETIMIGDNIKTDIMGAKNSNIDQIWFNPSSVSDENNICPTFQIKKLEDIKTIL